MDRFYLVLRELRDDDGPKGRRFYGIGTYSDIYKARAEATRQASMADDGRPRFVAEVLGGQVAVYDPEIGWEPAE